MSSASFHYNCRSLVVPPDLRIREDLVGKLNPQDVILEKLELITQIFTEALAKEDGIEDIVLVFEDLTDLVKVAAEIAEGSDRAKSQLFRMEGRLDGRF